MGDFLKYEFGCRLGWFGCPVGSFSLMGFEFDCPVGLFGLMGREFDCPVGLFSFMDCEFDCPLERFGFLGCGWSYYSQLGLNLVFWALKYGLQWMLNLSLSYFDATRFARYLTV
jgi:hypothetical protein